jgi:biopolymer transport protein ExbB
LKTLLLISALALAALFSAVFKTECLAADTGVRADAKVAQTVSADNSNPKSSTLGEMLDKGGPLMPVLYALSFIALCLAFYYMFSLRMELVVPGSLADQIEEAVKKKDMLLVEEICSKNDAPLSKVVKAGLEVILKPNANYTIMKDAMEDEGARQGNILWHRIQYLQDIAIVSPMVGLLGTVFGMIVSFGALNSENMSPKPTIIANGVAMALITTAAGLVIAIPAMLAYAYFRGRVNGLISELESRSGRFSRNLSEFIKQI